MTDDLSLCVPKQQAQEARKHLEKVKLWDSSRKLTKVDNQIAIPVFHHALEDTELITFLQKWPAAEMKNAPVVPSIKVTLKSDGQKLKEAVGKLITLHKLSETLIIEVPKKWERHGDLVILPTNAFTSVEWDELGPDLWKCVSDALNCQRIARHSRVADDGYRSPQVSLLWGENGNVVHIDNGIKYSFDVKKCMFSSGNITEKLRVASWNCRNEVVVDLYAGIGYFTLPYLVHAKAKHVHACEWNPDALTALKNNLVLNSVQDRCTVHEGDNRKLRLSNVADRVNLGLIPTSVEGWCVATRMLKDTGGMLHIHHNITTEPTTHQLNQSEMNNTSCMLHSESKFQNSALTREQFDDASNNLSKISEQDSFCGSPKPTNTLEMDNNCFVDSGHDSSGCCDFDGTVSSPNTTKQSHGIGQEGLNQKYLPWAKETCKKFEEILRKEKNSDTEWMCEIVHIEKVKSYAPHIDHVVLDLRCTPSNQIT